MIIWITEIAFYIIVCPNMKPRPVHIAEVEITNISTCFIHSRLEIN